VIRRHIRELLPPAAADCTAVKIDQHRRPDSETKTITCPPKRGSSTRRNAAALVVLSEVHQRVGACRTRTAPPGHSEGTLQPQDWATGRPVRERRPQTGLGLRVTSPPLDLGRSALRPKRSDGRHLPAVQLLAFGRSLSRIACQAASRHAHTAHTRAKGRGWGKSRKSRRAHRGGPSS
jgi:hypothetical protein